MGGGKFLTARVLDSPKRLQSTKLHSGPTYPLPVKNYHYRKMIACFKRTTICMIAVPMLFFLYVGSGLAENEVAIVSPQNGDEVKSFVIVKGVANITDASFVWVLAHREDLENQWWPQDEPKVAGSE